MLRECGRDGLPPPEAIALVNNVAWARCTGSLERFMDGCLERGKAPNRNCWILLFIVELFYSSTHKSFKSRLCSHYALDYIVVQDYNIK
jgi:hypothetical protein